MFAILALGCWHDDEVGMAADGSVRVLLSNSVMNSYAATAVLTNPSREVFTIIALFNEDNTTRKLTITVYSSASAEPITAGTYMAEGSSASGSRQSIVTYDPGNGGALMSSADVLATSAGSISIMEVDRTNHTVSGTFEVKVALREEVKSFTKGSFRKIPYTE